MNRNHLALFHAVAQAGGISRGAQRVRVSQPAVSKQIRELEEALGTRLLERLPRGTRLTESGRILAGYAQRLQALEQEAEAAMKEFHGLQRGRLAVGASMTIGTHLIPQAFGEFHRRYPDIELHLEIANTRTIRENLMQGVIEIGLTEGLIQGEHFDSEIFFQDELVAIAPCGHPLLKAGPVSARRICEEPFILREEGSGTREVVERALGKRGLAVQPVLSLTSPEAIKNAVVAGLGLAIISRLTIGLELRAGSLAIIPVKDLVIHRPLHLQRLRGRTMSPATAKFLEILAATKSQ
ncbi:MAG TPA: LysR family transcriptional regulator [Candidatus Acidoferrum sp.]|nr:LysR family transcriptional regulator [Candidatus Acidoferrum sp.]